MTECTLNDPIHVHRYFDGELNADETSPFEEHLVHCSSCQAALVELTQLSSRVRGSCVAEYPAEWTGRFVRRARDMQLQRSRRIAWGLVAAASFLLLSSLFLVRYSQFTEADTPVIMAQWEEYVVSLPAEEEEYAELESRTLVAIHIQKNSEKREQE